MTDIYTIIELIRKRPPLYIGDSKLSTLSLFLEGARFGLQVNKIKESPNFIDFHTWVRNRYKLEPMSLGYNTTILEKCSGDEEKALHLFFALVEEFKKNPN